MSLFHPKTLSIQAVMIAALVGLAGCMTVPPSSMLKLSRLSPLEADPSAIQFAVRLSDQLLVRDGDVRLRIRFDGDAPGMRLVEEYAALVTDAPHATPGIAAAAQDGMHVIVAALAEEDARSFAQVQRRIRDWRAAGVEGKGQLSVSATACADGVVPDGPLYVTTYIQTVPGEPFFILSRRADLRALMAGAGAPSNTVPSCTDPAIGQ